MKNSFRPANAYSYLKLRPVTVAFLLLLFLTASRSAYGQWTNPDGNQNINNTNTGNVGIGTSNPTAKLEVNKNQNAGTAINLDNGYTGASNTAFSGIWFKQGGANRFVIASNNDNNSTQNGGPGGAMFWNFANGPTLFATNNTEQMRITAAGNVGIGVTAPDSKLQVHHFSNNTNLANLGYPDLAFAFRNTSNTNNNMSLISFQDAAGWGNAQIGAVQKDQTNHHADLLFFTRNGGTALAERMRIRNDGKVGIGFNTPTAQLHVMASDGEALRVYRNANSAGFGVAQYFSLNNSSGVATDYAQISGGVINNTAGSENGALAFYVRGTGTMAERMRIHSNGNVSIGTDQLQTYKFHVQGGSINSSEALCINGDCRSSWSLVTGAWNSGSGSINYSGGSVGIGISTPLYALDVNGGANGFRAKAASASGSDTIAAFENNSAIKMIVRANGNVGIGKPDPAKPLDVVGDINASGTITGGNIQAKYQDVAEWVESSQELSAGTVVVLDPDKNNQVVASTQSYDSSVAGVISLQPGIALGEHGEGRVLVATTGRVKVKVDASKGPIRIGDLLVTGEKEGVAMKSVPVEFGGVRMHRPGTLIGKALEPLAHGTGEILVLLSLQ